MSLIQPLPFGPLDIVGDIHGELDALQALLHHLGYSANGQHTSGRTLVFVGDFVDRGPNSPGVLALVQQLVEAGTAYAIAGNHEINLLRHDAKDGSSWFFDERLASDALKYQHTTRVTDTLERTRIESFLSSLPLGLERADLRVVHAAWFGPDITKVRAMPLGSVRQEYDDAEAQAQQTAVLQKIALHMEQEKQLWPYSLEAKEHCPPFLKAHAANELNKATLNPLKVLTTGLESQASAPFFAGNKWRFVQRTPWWNDYAETIPVVIGHYWRSTLIKHSTHEGLFTDLDPFAWHGMRNNVFCVDYSIGAKAQAQTMDQPTAHLKLAALRWPERTLMFHTGEQHATIGFLQPANDTAP